MRSFFPGIDIKSHRHGNRDRSGDRKSPPGAFCQSVDHHKTQPRKRENDNEKNRYGTSQTRHRSQFFFSNLCQRFPVTANGHNQNHKIMHCAAKHGPY